MKLLVSVPPVLRGEPFHSQAGESLQMRIIRSWIKSSFTPVSINTPAELAAYPAHAEELARAGVALLVVPSSGVDYPSHLPNLREALRIAIDRFPGELLALTNADIHIRLSSRQQQQLIDLGLADFCQAHRLDVLDTQCFECDLFNDLPLLDCSPFLHGIDFLAARAETFHRAIPSLSPALTIGLPWWDLLLPLALFNAGAFRQFLDHRSFLHLVHDDRWDQKWFLRVGTCATRYLASQIKRYRSAGVAYVWMMAYQRAVSLLQPPKVMKWRLHLLYYKAKQGIYRYPASIPEVNRITELMVCRQGAELDRRWLMDANVGPI